MIIIKKNNKKQHGWYFPFCKKSLELRFSFNETFDYIGKNQTDIHKIIGIGILSFPHSFKKERNKKWWELHKWISLRVGARRNYEKDCIEVTDYSYINGIGERDTRDNNILEAQKEDIIYAKITIFSKSMSLILINETTQQHIETIIPCELPKYYLCMRLRAYMENVFRTKDIIINTYKTNKNEQL